MKIAPVLRVGLGMHGMQNALFHHAFTSKGLGAVPHDRTRHQPTLPARCCRRRTPTRCPSVPRHALSVRKSGPFGSRGTRRRREGGKVVLKVVIRGSWPAYRTAWITASAD